LSVPAPPRRPRAAAEAGDRHSRICLEAARLFAAKGYEATSMSDIAAAVQITKAGLYHFVESKEALLFTIMNHSLDRLHRQVIEPARAVSDPLERLRLIVRNHIRSVVTTEAGASPLAIIVDAVQGLSHPHRERIDQRKREYIVLLRETLEELQAQGRVAAAADPAVTAFSIIGMMMWIPRWRRAEGPMSLSEVADQIVSLATSGLLVQPGPAALPPK
jgi:AcrR family transcriptional regulator